MLKDNRKTKKKPYDKDPVKCPFCGYKFDATIEDVFYIEKIKCYYCQKCGEEIIENLKIK